MNKKTHLTQKELSKEYIYTALIELMKSKHFNEISISEITTKAGVSRMTFYRNYPSKEAVITNRMDNIFNQYINTVILCPDNVYDNIYVLLGFWEKHSDLIKCLIKSDMESLLLEQFSKQADTILNLELVVNRYFHDKHAQKYSLKFFMGGIYMILINWVTNDLSDSREYITSLICQLYGLKPTELKRR